MNTKNKVLGAYIVLMSSSLTLSYMVYTEFLSNFNWGMSMFLFGIMNILMLKTFYLPVQDVLFKVLNVKYNRNEESISIVEALKRNGKLVLIYSTISSVSFCCMLPFLTSLENAFLFILFSSLGRLIQVPLAQHYLNDEIEKKWYYYSGLIISIAGSVGYQSLGMEQIGFGDPLGLICALIHLLAVSCNSIIFKKITSKIHAGERYIPVQTASMISVLVRVIFGATAAIVILSYNDEPTASLIPNGQQFIALFSIGFLVPLFGTLASKLVNLLSHALIRAADGIRIVSGLVLLIIFAALNGTLVYLAENGIEKFLSIVVILTGVALSFEGKPRATVKNLESQR